MATPTAKCLGVAEQIIRVLDDPSIYERYMKLKEKMLLAAPHSSPPNPQARQLILENRSLVLRIEELKADSLKQKHLESWVITQIQLLQSQLLPASSRLTYASFSDASNNLLDTIEAKLASHRFLRDRLIEENRLLQESIQSMKDSVLTQIEESRKRRVDSDADWERTRSNVLAKIDDMQEKIAKARVKLSKLQEKTFRLRTAVSKLPQPEVARVRVITAEDRLNKADDRKSQLRHERDKLRLALRELDNELIELHRIEQFGVDPGAKRWSADTGSLEAEIVDLEKQNGILHEALRKVRSNG
jgi:hypothetical protein